MWNPASGEIRLDGATFDQWDGGRLGRFIGYLPQDIELFDGTIAENIARLQASPSSDDVVKAAMQAGAHEMIKRVGGYETQIGPGGSNLSAGQRQRVALARAMYGEPPLVILDEPNSNLDEEGEEALYSAIVGMRDRGQTVITIAHRTKTLNLADDLLVLNSGAQVAFGGREDVLSELRRRQGAKPRAQAMPNQWGTTGSGVRITAGGQYAQDKPVRKFGSAKPGRLVSGE